MAEKEAVARLVELQAIEGDRQVILRDLLVACVVARVSGDHPLQDQRGLTPFLGVEEALALSTFFAHLAGSDGLVGLLVVEAHLARGSGRGLVVLLVTLLVRLLVGLFVVLLFVCSGRRGFLALTLAKRGWRNQQCRDEQADTGEPIPHLTFLAFGGVAIAAPPMSA